MNPIGTKPFKHCQLSLTEYSGFCNLVLNTCFWVHTSGKLVIEMFYTHWNVFWLHMNFSSRNLQVLWCCCRLLNHLSISETAITPGQLPAPDLWYTGENRCTLVHYWYGSEYSETIITLFDKKLYYAWKMKLAPSYFSDKTSWACLAPVEWNCCFPGQQKK